MKKILIVFLFCFLLASCSLNSSFTLNKVLYYSSDGDYTNDNLKANGPYTRYCMPSCGDVNVLVIPINFNDSYKNDIYLDELNVAFNGSSNDLDFESVRSYYYKSSYTKLTLNFDITSWYTPKYDKSYYENYSDLYESGSTLLLREAIANFDNEYDYAKYDSDNDSVIDAVWLVYNEMYIANNDFWWNYTFFNQTSNVYDNKYLRYYSFGSLHMLHYNSILIDAHTFIHETGHLFGLEDYYSYKTSQGPMLGRDMMDENLGDHSSFSKLLLGWATPKVITESGTYSLNDFSTTGEFIIIPINHLDTIYQEYYIIDFYGDMGLDNYDNVYEDYGVGAKGVRVYHADASIFYDEDTKEISFTTGTYKSAFKYNNSNESKFMLKLLRADKDKTPSFKLTDYETYKYLYTPFSNKFGIDVYSDYKSHDGIAINFTMEVLSILNKANIKITFK